MQILTNPEIIMTLIVATIILQGLLQYYFNTRRRKWNVINVEQRWIGFVIPRQKSAIGFVANVVIKRGKGENEI